MAQQQKPKTLKTSATNNNNINAKKEMQVKQRNSKSQNTNTFKTKLNEKDTLEDNEKSSGGKPKQNRTREKLNKQQKGRNGNEKKSVAGENKQESSSVLSGQQQEKQNIDKYSPESISRMLCSVDKQRCLRDDQTTYITNFLNELKNNDLVVLEYNLQLIKAIRPMHDDALYCLLTLVLKSTVKWSPEQINLILNLYYDLENSQKQNRFHPETIMHVQVERLCPYQMAYFYDCMTNSWKFLTSERYEYLMKFLNNLKHFNNREADDYFTFLRVNGFLKRDKLVNLIDFLTDTKRQWKPNNYQKLEALLKRQMAKKVILDVAKPKKTVNKNKKYTNTSNRLVHHQNTQKFSQIINYLTNGGILNEYRLNILNDFIQELLQMNHNENELINYLATLKCRRILNNAANYYLKNLIQEKAIPLDMHQRQILLNALQTLSDKKKPRILTVSLLNLKSRSDLFHKLNNNRTSITTCQATLNQTGKIATEPAVNTPTTSTPTSEKIPDNNSIIMSKIDFDNDNVKENELMSPISSSIQEEKLLKIGNYSPPKMSEHTRKKVKRFFYRLRASIYFARRLKYYQKIFRAII